MSACPIIAVVDDDTAVRGSLISLLRSAGMSARSFAGAKDLLAAEADSAFACIVTDLHMPDMTGLELQAEIARRNRDVPVIIMTAYPTDAARDQALRAGAVAFLTKPVDPEGLLEAIEQAIR